MIGMPEASGAQQRLLLVDEPEEAALLQRILLASGYEEVAVADDLATLPQRVATEDPDLVILGLDVPGVEGFALLESIVAAGIPVLALVGEDAPTVRRRALGLGARDLVVRPLDRVEVLLRVANLLQTRRLQRALEERNSDLQHWVRSRTADLDQARRETLERLALAAEYRDEDTTSHTQRVGRTAALLARGLGLSGETVEHLRFAAPLHDVGKIGLPDAIWLKPGRLTDEERAQLEEHTVIGARILGGSRSPVLRLAEQIALSHHERWDGSGYPGRLRGDEIPLAGRITAVADVFDVLAHPRPHKQAWPLEQAVAEIVAQGGKQFDPSVVAAFRRLDAASLLEPVAEHSSRAAA